MATTIVPLVKKKRISHLQKHRNEVQEMPSPDFEKMSKISTFWTDIAGTHNDLPSAASSSQNSTQHFSSSNQVRRKNQPMTNLSTYARKKLLPTITSSHKPKNLGHSLMNKTKQEFNQVKHNQKTQKQEAHLARLPDEPVLCIDKPDSENDSSSENPKKRRFLSGDSAVKPKKSQPERRSLDESNLQRDSTDSAVKTKKPQPERTSMDESHLKRNSTNSAVKPKKPQPKRSLDECHLERSSTDSGVEPKKPQAKRRSLDECHLQSTSTDSAVKPKKPQPKSISMKGSHIKRNVADSAQKKKTSPGKSVPQHTSNDEGDKSVKVHIVRSSRGDSFSIEASDLSYNEVKSVIKCWQHTSNAAVDERVKVYFKRSSRGKSHFIEASDSTYNELQSVIKWLKN